MSKAEKRHFKLYARRNLSEKDTKFVLLFDVLDKMQEYDEEKLRRKLPQVQGKTLSNLKAHLYEQLLVSLRLLHHKTPSIRIREIISFADLLYTKGLFRQSLALLGKARQLATEHEDEIHLLEITEFEKLIESRHITRSGDGRARKLISESERIGALLTEEQRWSNLALRLYDYYLRAGHTRNKAEYDQLTSEFKAYEARCDGSPMSIHGRIYKQQAYVWFYYIIQEFALCYRHASKWVAEMEAAPEFIRHHPGAYVKGLHNCLAVLFYCNEPLRFDRVFLKLQQFLNEFPRPVNRNTHLLNFVYLETAQLNRFFLAGQFTEGAAAIPAFEGRLEAIGEGIDQHRIRIFWYKIACLYFGSGNYQKASHYLTRIINYKADRLREDVQCFARILNLISHYEMGNDDLIDYQIRSTYRFLLKMEDLQMVQQAVLSFLKRSVYMDRRDLRSHFSSLKSELEDIMKDRFQRRPFLYLDLISWLESKIHDRKVESIIREKQSQRG